MMLTTMRHARLTLFALSALTCARFVQAAPSAPALVETLREDDEATVQAAEELLVKMGPDAVGPLEKVLNDPNFKLRRRAADVLARLGPQAKHAAPDLIGLLVDPQMDVQAAAQKALVQIGDSAVPALTEALKSQHDGLRRVALVTLARASSKGIPIIISLLKKDESAYVRSSAAEALAATRPMTPLISQALMEALTGDLEESVRGTAADAMGQNATSSKAAIGPLLAMAQRDRDALTRKKAADALIHIGPATKESLPGLIAGLKDPSQEARRNIIDAIGKSSIPPADAIPVLESAIKDPDAGVRLNVIRVCVAVTRPSPACLPLLKQTINDPSVDVRSAVMAGLGQMKAAAAEAAAELGKLHSDPNAVIRQNAIHALGNLGMAGLPGLVQALEDTYSALSDDAAKSIVRLGPDAVPALQALEQSSDPVMKKKARDILRRIQKTKPRRHSSS